MAGGVGFSLWLAYSSTDKQASSFLADANPVLQMIVFIVFFFLVVGAVFAVQVLGVFCAMVRGCLILLSSVWVPDPLLVAKVLSLCLQIIRTNRSAEALGWHVRVLKAPLAILWGLFYPSLLGFSVSGKRAQPWCCTSAQ